MSLNLKKYFLRATKVLVKFLIGFIIIAIGLAVVQIKTKLDPPSHHNSKEPIYFDSSSSYIAEKREKMRKLGRELIQDNISYSTDQKYVYYKGKVIKGADPSTFYVKDRFIRRGFRSKDKNNYYYQGKKSTFLKYYGEDILILICLPFGILSLFLFICFLDYKFPSRRFIFENFYIYLGVLLPLYAFWVFPIIFDHFQPYASSKEPAEKYLETAINDYKAFLILSIPLYISFIFIKSRKIYYIVCFLNLIFLYIAILFLEAIGSLG